MEITDDFENFSLSFGDGTYTSQNGKNVWPGSGTWKFVAGSTEQVERDDGVVVIDLSISDGQLTLSLEIDEDVFSIGRAKTIASRFVFVLTN